jgi:hypothetical protein
MTAAAKMRCNKSLRCLRGGAGGERRGEEGEREFTREGARRCTLGICKAPFSEGFYKIIELNLGSEIHPSETVGH